MRIALAYMGAVLAFLAIVVILGLVAAWLEGKADDDGR